MNGPYAELWTRENGPSAYGPAELFILAIYFVIMLYDYIISQERDLETRELVTALVYYTALFTLDAVENQSKNVQSYLLQNISQMPKCSYLCAFPK